MLRVLLVDDEPFIIQGLKILIDWEQEGFEIAGTAANGQEAYEFLQKDKVDLIIADIKMPVMNGLEATKIIRESNTEIPIIMQTAYAFSSDKENAMNAGATEVLVKPITLGILRTTLSKYLPDLQW